MAEQDNIQRVKDSYALLGRRDLSAFLDTVADDIVFVVPGPTDLPWVGSYRGKQGVASWFATLELMDFQVFDVQAYIAQGDTVVVMVHEETIVRRTGRRCIDDEVHIWTFRDGQLVQFQEYYDTATYAAAYRGE
jgi:ketosteroid isomerase-like protein